MKLQRLLSLRWPTVCLLAASPAAAQAPKQPARPPAPAPVTVPATPQQTTATFGDWVVRCARPAGAAKTCEVAQLVQQDGKPVAQMAFGSTGKGKPMRLVVLVPPNVTLGGKEPALLPADGEPVSLAWQRCLPGGCVAEAEIADAPLNRIRGWTAPARLAYPDAVGRPVELPFSALGLRQALEALAKEEAAKEDTN